MKTLKLTGEETERLKKFATIVTDESLRDKDENEAMSEVAQTLEENDFERFFEIVNDAISDKLASAICKTLINSYDGFENILKKMTVLPEDTLYCAAFQKTAILIPNTITKIASKALWCYYFLPTDAIIAVFIPESVTYLNYGAIDNKTIVCFECDRPEAYRNIKGDFNFESNRCFFNYTREKFIKEFGEDII